jgi:RNA polymerase sigma-70 factor (ECF subfamily)
MRKAADADIDELFRAHYGPLVAGLALAAGSMDAAKDAVQDAFLQLHRHWRKVSTYEDPVAWLQRVATNRVANQRRDRGRADELAERLSPALRATTDDDGRAAQLDLLAAVAALPRGQRLVVGLHHLTGLPIREVAAAMEISEGTVKSQLHDARAALRTTLEVDDRA